MIPAILGQQARHPALCRLPRANSGHCGSERVADDQMSTGSSRPEPDINLNPAYLNSWDQPIGLDQHCSLAPVFIGGRERVMHLQIVHLVHTACTMCDVCWKDCSDTQPISCTEMKPRLGFNR